MALSALLAAVSLPVTVSHAADAVIEPPAPAFADTAPQAVGDWSGVYLGGSVGWGKANTFGYFDSSQGDPEDRVDGTSFDLNGFTGSVHLGYNHQLSNKLVLGIEGDWSFINWSETLTDGDTSGTGDDTATYEINWLATLRGRLGAAINNNSSLIYATGGVAWIDASYTACDECNDPVEVNSGTVEFDDIGLVAGLGFEHKLSSAFSVRAEGLYYHWNNAIDTSDLTVDSDDGDFAEIRDAFQVRVGLSYHF